MPAFIETKIRKPSPAHLQKIVEKVSKTNELKSFFFVVKTLPLCRSLIYNRKARCKMEWYKMKLENLNPDLRSELDLMLTLKMKDLRSNQFKTITRQQVIDYLFNVKWKRHDKLVTCDIVNDIFEVTASQIFDYLRAEGIKMATKQKLEDFSDMFV